MTRREEFLFNLRKINGGKVLMGNDHMCSITGIGSAKFQLWDDSIRTIENIRLVLELRRNLLSLGMFDSNGCSYKSEKGNLESDERVTGGVERTTTTRFVRASREGNYRCHCHC